MYLAALQVNLDLEPEVTATDRVRVLRSLRDKLKQQFGSRLTVRTDEESALFVSVLDDNFERLKARMGAIVETIDTAGQARVADSNLQIFSWFEGRFKETRNEFDGNLDTLRGDDSQSEDESDNNQGFPRGRPGPIPTRNSRPAEGFSGSPRRSQDKSRTVVYVHEDEDLGGTTSRLSRRSMRIPARK